MRRITKAFPDTRWAPHLYTTYEAARALVRARTGSTILPAMALAGAHTEGMRITPLPSLGTRKILLRHKNHGWSEASGARRHIPGGVEAPQRLVLDVQRLTEEPPHLTHRWGAG